MCVCGGGCVYRGVCVCVCVCDVCVYECVCVCVCVCVPATLALTDSLATSVLCCSHHSQTEQTHTQKDMTGFGFEKKSGGGGGGNKFS